MNNRKDVKTETQPINWKQAQTIVKTLQIEFQDDPKKDYRDLLLFACGFYFGLRIGDILQLTWEQIEKETFTLTEQKTKKTRQIQVSDNFRKIFKAVDKEIYKKAIPEGYIFTPVKRYTGKPMSVRGANDRIKAVFKRTGIEVQNPSSHTLRKTFGKRVYEANNKSEDALILLGQIFNHRDVATTRKYIGLTKERILNAYLSL